MTAEAQTVVLPTEIDLAQLTSKLAVVRQSPREADQSPVPVLQDEDEIASLFLPEHFMPLLCASSNGRSTRRVIRRIPGGHVQLGQRRNVGCNGVTEDD